MRFTTIREMKSVGYAIKVAAKLCFLVLLASSPAPSFAQAGAVLSGQVVNRSGVPQPYATVRICPSTGAGVPCTPTASIYSDPGLTQPLTNPTTADQNGIFSVFVGTAYQFYLVQTTFGTTTYAFYENGSQGSGVFCPLTGCTITGNLIVTGSGTFGSLVNNGALTQKGASSFGSSAQLTVDTSGNLSTSGTVAAGASLQAPYYSITGLSGDGVTDNSVAWPTAVALIKSVNGGKIVMPPGVFKFTTTCPVLTTGSDGLTIEGGGDYPGSVSAPQIAHGTTFWCTVAGSDVLNVNAATGALSNVQIRHLYLKGPGANTTGDGLHVDATANSISYLSIEDVSASGVNNQFRLQAGNNAGGFLFKWRLANSGWGVGTGNTGYFAVLQGRVGQGEMSGNYAIGGLYADGYTSGLQVNEVTSKKDTWSGTLPTTTANGTFASGASTITVSSVSGVINPGVTVFGAGLGNREIVTAVNGSTITIWPDLTTAPETNTPLSFSHYCVSLHDVQNIHIEDSHFETCNQAGNILANGFRALTVDGTPYFAQVSGFAATIGAGETNNYGFKWDTPGLVTTSWGSWAPATTYSLWPYPVVVLDSVTKCYQELTQSGTSGASITFPALVNGACASGTATSDNTASWVTLNTNVPLFHGISGNSTSLATSTFGRTANYWLAPGSLDFTPLVAPTLGANKYEGNTTGNYSFVDTGSAQTVGGNKTFTGLNTNTQVMETSQAVVGSANGYWSLNTDYTAGNQSCNLLNQKQGASSSAYGKVCIDTSGNVWLGPANGSTGSVSTGIEIDTSGNVLSPHLTGTPTAPTATVGTNTTQVATTAFVQAAIPIQYSVSWTPVAATVSACTEQTVTVTGITTTKQLGVNPPASMGTHVWIGSVRPSASNTAAVSFCADATGGTPPSGTWLFKQ